ncbi:hypothetical protein OK006_8314 [Actinobacteria bacterium OK006]|nr:hypothetical protein OK006_8314 [Actinobacteria bacterium OK006]
MPFSGLRQLRFVVAGPTASGNADFLDAGPAAEFDFAFIEVVKGIRIEDLRDPKKSGGVASMEPASGAEAIGRLTVAVDECDRRDHDSWIVIRTTATGPSGAASMR